MIIKGKSVTDYKTNIVEKQCPVCGKSLRLKRACCGQKQSLLVCICGYKEIANA